MQYTLQLVDEKVKQQQVTALHLISALAFIGAGAVIFKFNAQITYWGLALFWAGLALLSVTLKMNRFVTAPDNNRLFRVVEWLISGALLAYSIMQGWKVPIGLFGVLSAALLFSLFLEDKANAAQFVTVDDKGMILPSGIRNKVLEWTGIEKVILRFGVLTVNTTDNFRYQWNVHKPDFDAAAFEQYCSTQVEAARPRRGKEDW